ncbi:GGDEF domain-containing protein [Aureimonas leprariae]|uniref:diguanylate cyclase n=1 Tax=Plantimonas leprariae TaxID=2615207 RepID=A0A7V7PS33_9HYPH|nr:GGDEF domain-containing protein [Aureimonas leprariae]KAB0681884.1 GGDEF domain-containing protein [Aureimonas leprariae]
MGEEAAQESRGKRDAWKLVSINVAGVTLCVLVSLAFNAVLFWHSDAAVFAKGMISAVALPLLLGIPLFLYLSLQMRNLSKLNAHLTDSAARDGLTRLLNRGAFVSQVTAKLAEMEQLDAPRGALLVIDADFFKLINDRHGHAKGDEALCQIAAAIGRLTRGGDLAGRLGGEEFAVFLYGSSPTAARAAAERLRSTVEGIELFSGEERVSLTISVGAVHFREVLPFSTFYQLADRMLYEAKGNGRNRVEFEHLSADASVEVAA